MVEELDRNLSILANLDLDSSLMVGILVNTPVDVLFVALVVVKVLRLLGLGAELLIAPDDIDPLVQVDRRQVRLKPCSHIEHEVLHVFSPSRQ